MWSQILKQPAVFTLRKFFLLVTPNETSYEYVENVPDYIEEAIPFFIIFIILEFIILYLQNKELPGVRESMTSISGGLFSLMPMMFSRPVEIVAYIFIYDNYRIVTLPWNNPLVWYACFIGTDFAYYWIHRFSHEVNIMWAAHQMHHSSEEYNMSTALRQSVLQRYNTWIFYLPMAFGIPPTFFMVHAYFNLIYQFWIHTEVIDKLGPLEYIFNTPSHHRVHHGRNSKYIHVNYGGILIVWDRLFKTFKEEEERPVYGHMKPLTSSDPLFTQFFHYEKIFKDMSSRNSIGDKFRTLLLGSRWYPGSSGLLSESFLQGDPAPKFVKSPVGTLWNTYAIVQFFFSLIMFLVLSLNKNKVSTWTMALGVSYLMWTLTGIGFVFDKKWFTPYLELIRILAFVLIDFWINLQYFANIYLVLAMRMISICSCLVWIMEIGLTYFYVSSNEKQNVHEKVKNT